MNKESAKKNSKRKLESGDDEESDEEKPAKKKSKSAKLSFLTNDYDSLIYKSVLNYSNKLGKNPKVRKKEKVGSSGHLD